MHQQPTQRRTTRLAAVALGIVVTLAASACSPALSESEPPAPVMTSSAPPAMPPTTTDDDATATPLPDIPVVRADAASAPKSAEKLGLGANSLQIVKHNIVIPVRPVGVETNGDMEVPPSSDEAGWYRFGAGIGTDGGTAVIAGHVDSYVTNSLGPLAGLAQVREGDLVEVTRADDVNTQYVIAAVNRTKKTRIDWQEVFSREGEHRLVIVTCGGTFDRAAGHYEDNVIVTATPVGAKNSK